MPDICRLTAVFASVLLLGCVPQTPTIDIEDTDACGASAMQDLVGQPFSALAAMTFAMPMRLIRPDMAVTMDYVPERLNIYMSAADVIESVSCG